MARKAINNALNDLSRSNLEAFCSSLLERKEGPRIRRAAIEDKSIIQITDKILEAFTEDPAVYVVVEILKEIDCNKVAKELEDTWATQSKGTTAPIPPARPPAPHVEVRGITMKATELITKNKIQLQRILMVKVLFAIQCVFEAKLLPDFEYITLKCTAESNPFKAATDLVDNMIFLGEETCKLFLRLLQDTQLTDMLRDLKTMPWYSPPAANISNDPTTTHFDATQNGGSGRVINNVNSAPPNLGLGTDAPNGKETYKMSSVPRGYCLILENETFTDPELEQRKGTESDSLRLAQVYHWLGFTVILCKDKTKAQMVEVLKLFARLQSALPKDTPELLNLDLKQWSGKRFIDVQRLDEHGDGFVCCILSHGEEKGVCGADGQILSTREIRSAFSNIQCPALQEKPKVFFIQACRGELDQTRVFQTDTRSLPEITDFLFAYATIDLYTSLRHAYNGSWFIQTLCDKLENGCPRGYDINTILTHVNDAVCKKNCKLKNDDGDMVDFKQSTVFENNLRKLLIFHPV